MGILETLMGKIKAPLQDLRDNLSEILDGIENSPDQEAGIAMGGLNGQRIADSRPIYTGASHEKILQNGTNAWIVIGRDRVSNKGHGMGAEGATGAGSLDLVVGRQPLDPKLNIDPNFTTDAARIHVSQLTNVDENFGLCAGSIGKIKHRAAIGMKADEIRIVARNGIKIITEGRGATNSKGGKIKTTSGIDLIAGNDDSFWGGPQKAFADLLSGDNYPNPVLQPLVKGGELVDCIHEIMDLMDSVAAMSASTCNNLAIMNIAMASHFHQSPFLGLPTTPSITLAGAALASNTQLFMNCIAPMFLHRVNVVTFKMDYLKQSGSKWINSRYNNTN